jgi:DNA-binding cell septation regulator SpoVG
LKEGVVLMDLKSKLKEFDEKIVLHKVVMIEGKECIVFCYPKVKDNPNHYSDRNGIIKTDLKQNKRGHRR